MRLQLASAPHLVSTIFTFVQAVVTPQQIYFNFYCVPYFPNMALIERLYFTVMIPVTLVVLITIMAHYTYTEIGISSQLKQNLNSMTESKNVSVVGYEECDKDLERTIQEVESRKKELNELSGKKTKMEEQLKICKDGVKSV